MKNSEDFSRSRKNVINILNSAEGSESWERVKSLMPEEMRQDIEAMDIAVKAKQQFDSLTPDAWAAQGADPKKALSIAHDNLLKLFEDKDDIVLFGKALTLAQDMGQEMVDTISRVGKFKHLSKTKRLAHENALHLTRELIVNSISYIVLMKFKQDVMQNYELNESKPKK